MLTDAIEYFTPIESEDRVALLTICSELFDKYGFSGPDVDTSMALDDTRAAGETSNMAWDRVYVIIEAALDMLLTGMGLALSYASILHKIQLLDAMWLLENTDMHDYIVDTIENGAVDMREKFEDLIEFAMGHQPNWIDTELDVVPETIIIRLLAVHKPFVENEQEITNAPDMRLAIQRLKTFNAYCVKHNVVLRMHELVEAGVKPGLPTDFLLNNNLSYITEYEPIDISMPTAPDMAAMQLLGLLLLCNIDFTQLTQIASSKVEQYYNDPAFITAVSNEMSRIISESGVQDHFDPNQIENGVDHG